MNKINKNLEIRPPINQLNLFGFNNYFNSFAKLYKKNKLPNTILLSGQKGSGKATFAYHFINYLLSSNESDKYSLDNYSINSQNKSFINLSNGTHPNFFLLDGDNDVENIKIENVRNVFKFLNQSTFSSNKKIVLIDNAEYLNINSSNALLKVLEEPDDRTYFFIINNTSNRISETIKSRCIEFKIFFSMVEKKNILTNICNEYNFHFNIDEIDKNFYIDSPGNILNYLKILNDKSDSLSIEDKLSCISYLIDKYKKTKNIELLSFISFLVELFYSELTLKNNKKLNRYFYNKFKILKEIANAKRFNLDKNNLFISLYGILKNES